MRSFVLSLLIVFAVILLTSCSSRQLGYRYAETLVSWQAGNYVSLNEAQDALLREETEQFLQWHAQTHMPKYHQLLTDVSQLLHAPELTTDILIEKQEIIANYWYEIRLQLIAPSVRLLKTLDDDQVAELIENLQARLEKQQDRLEESGMEIAGGNENYPQQRRADRFMDSFRSYAGKPNDEQTQRIMDWSMQAPIVNKQWYRYQQQWHEAFVRILENRHDDNFSQVLQDLYLEPEQFRGADMNAQLEITEQASLALMVALHESLSIQQRSKLARRIDKLRRDIRGMMKQRNVEF